MKKITFIFALTVVLSIAGLTESKAQISVSITNGSSWDFYEVYMTATDYESWGEDLLDMSEQYILMNGQTININVPSEGEWDLKIIDEDGDECVVYGIYVSHDADVTINDDVLLDCMYGN